MIRLEMLWNTIANYFDQFRFIWPLKKASLLQGPLKDSSKGRTV